ncbi:Ltp family lipoprotein [Mycolicibacterium helvum]|uniref:DUF2510 domain-containing protein n=1 Tax=Mycolicibacterium helvum TaxID=1534349 RepID=A0A7I7T885_9MYCO|nr:Ltp family lipoprotein [Mycolicibacterium helvum]BBY64721.1 hypothetical protein MHEL_29640 [Mycolicibacterium helvum]
MSTPTTPAGWYPDPAGTGQQRYFDGTNWTDQDAPPAGAVVPGPPPKKSNRGKIILGAVGAVVVLLIVGAIVGGGDDTNKGTAAPTSSTANAAASEPPSPSAQTTTTEPADTETASQRNAMRKAQDYLDMKGFSRSGLITQLEFEGFSTSDATYAADHITVDWNEQATRAGKTYLEMSGFSRAGLAGQLEQGDGFTPEQAAYGAEHAGA